MRGTEYKTDNCRLSIHIEHPADIAYSVIITKEFCEKLDFNKNEQSLIATAVSELSTNIIRYAKSGSIFFNRIINNGKTGVMIIAEDNGPGIEDTGIALRPEYSTGGSLGLGLSSVKEIMDSFKIESVIGQGTKVTVTKWML